MNRTVIVLFVVLFACLSAVGQKKRVPKKASPVKPEVTIALPDSYSSLLTDAQQAIVVTTPGWNSIDGTLVRYEKRDGKWLAVGDKVPIVVGKNGLAWDGLLELSPGIVDPVKKEGDGRSPAGIFRIPELFGFAEDASGSKMAYRPLIASIECVDDPNSNAYAQVVDRAEIPYPDWNSSEKMRSVDVYKIGAVVGYNDLSVPGAGSCIFLHIWGGTGKGTAGCTAMDESKLREVLGWLDSTKGPVVIQFPAAVYERLRETWKLP